MKDMRRTEAVRNKMGRCTKELMNKEMEERGRQKMIER